MDFGISIVKLTLCLINTLFSICGILLVIFGVVLFNIVGEYHSLQEAVQYDKIPIGIVVLGSIVLLISMLGYDGIRESYCTSIAYVVILLLLLIVQLVCVVYLWADFWANFVNSMEKVVDNAWKDRSLNADFMHTIEVGFKCCGKNGPIDYLTSLSPLPSTCCENNDCTSPLDVYITGCKSSFTNFWAEKGDLFRFAGLVIVGMELVALIFGCCLASNAHKNKRKPDYKIVMSVPA